MKVCDFDGNCKEVDEKEYFENVRLKRNAKEPNKQYHEINVSGYSSMQFRDAQTRKPFSDIVYSRGKILFVGNWDQYDKYVEWLVENEGKLGIKLL